ncbi:MAG: TIGR01212 family radical SAM protein [Lachnospiraceae bacterium]|nr:TIGR01212 family radical SAM protein [Lachnospiraceae bacterium]
MTDTPLTTSDIRTFPDGKPYYSLNSWLKEQFGTKVYKLSLDGGMTCPNRDGTLGDRGCIFCSEGGSGDFAAGRSCFSSLEEQLAAARERVAKKAGSGPYIAYFQSFTNTYAPVSRLETLFSEVIARPDIAALSIGTRPDCLEPEKVRLLERLNRQKPVWVELGLQTIHPDTAAFIRRGYDLSCFEDAVTRLKAAGLTVIVHLILGLPGETKEQMLQSVQYIGNFHPAIDGIKLQLLHVLKGTDLAEVYSRNPFPVFTMEEYLNFVITCIEHLPPDLVIHRLTGDGPKKLLLAPEWSGNKKLVLNSLTRRFKERDAWQGKRWISEAHAGETHRS